MESLVIILPPNVQIQNTLLLSKTLAYFNDILNQENILLTPLKLPLGKESVGGYFYNYRIHELIFEYEKNISARKKACLI